MFFFYCEVRFTSKNGLYCNCMLFISSIKSYTDHGTVEFLFVILIYLLLFLPFVKGFDSWKKDLDYF